MSLASKKQTPLALFGEHGETITVQWLTKQGYYILHRNYHTRYGEIDVIARKEKVVAFIEVKIRTKNYFNLSEIINFNKQKKIIATARYFCTKELQGDEMIYRFDVALLHQHDNNVVIEYIENAFVPKEH